MTTALNPQRILVRGVNWLGDAVMTTPALLRLREAHPAAGLTLLTPEKLKDIWHRHPAIDAVETFTPEEKPWAIAGRLRPLKFDLGLVFPNSPRSALEVWLMRVPYRIGYARPWRSLLLSKALPPRPEAVEMKKCTAEEVKKLIQENPTKPVLSAKAHHIYQYLHLVEAAGASAEPLAPVLHVTPSEVQTAREKFELDAQTNWLGINPGAEYGPAKRWPAEDFLYVMREAAAWPKWGLILFGGPNDVAEAKKMEQEFWQSSKKWKFQPRLVNAAGQTSLRELMSALKICRVVLTNDSGPMHVAAAMGTRVVVPFGSTSPELTGPGLPGDPRHHLLRGRAPCSPCFLRECPIDLRCMKTIHRDRVAEAVAEAVE